MTTTIHRITPTDQPVRQYYYRAQGCNAASPESPDCICWYDEGTGPFADGKDMDGFSWRNKPQPDAPTVRPDETSGGLLRPLPGTTFNAPASPRLPEGLRAKLVEAIYTEVADRHRCAFLCDRILTAIAPFLSEPSRTVGEGETPRTDAVACLDTDKKVLRGELVGIVPANFARTLERDIAALQEWQLEAVHKADALERENAQLREEVARYRTHMREKIYVLANPDAELPMRILEAHIDNSTTESNPPALGDLMNKFRDERNAILTAAIASLTDSTSLRAQLSSAQARFEQLDAEYALAKADLFRAQADSERLLNVAQGCLDYCGGHHDKDLETYHHGIQTVINALRAAAKRDPNDTQINALERMGRVAARQRDPAQPKE